MLNEFPRMLYAIDGRTITVENETEEMHISSQGFRREPFDIHRTGSTPTATISADVQPDPNDEIIERVAQRVIELMGQTFPSLLIGSGGSNTVSDAYNPPNYLIGQAHQTRRGRPPKDRTALSIVEQD